MTAPESGQIGKEKVNLCKKKKVLEAISVLKQLNKKFFEENAEKQPLLEETSDSPIFLQVTLKKIPSKRLIQMIKVTLPHSIITDTTEVCLITGDCDKRNRKAEIEPDVIHYKELLKKHGVSTVTEVITLRQLRTEYKVYEAKRQLMGAYDIFLTDKKIAQCLPRLLGKIFIKKRKLPTQINMETSNLKDQIAKALSEAKFNLTCRGNSCTSEVARLSMEDKAIRDNILASVKVLSEKLPGKYKNILSIYIKTSRSKAIPVYLSFDNPNELKLKKPFKHEKVKAEELSTVPNATVKVFKDGTIRVHLQPDSDDEEGIKRIKHVRRKKSHKKKKMAEVPSNTEANTDDTLHSRDKTPQKISKQVDANVVSEQRGIDEGCKNQGVDEKELVVVSKKKSKKKMSQFKAKIAVKSEECYSVENKNLKAGSKKRKLYEIYENELNVKETPLKKKTKSKNYIKMNEDEDANGEQFLGKMKKHSKKISVHKKN